jgi:polar amino acid transport system permease protein
VGSFLHEFFSPLDFLRSTPQVWDGFKLNIQLMLVAEALVLPLALVVAIVRGLPGRAAAPFRAAAIAYTDIFRGTPLILVLLMVNGGFATLNYFGLSANTLFKNGVIALVLVYTAYVTEVYRAGIESVHPSQRMAPLLNDFVGLQKDTALVTVIGLTEAATQAGFYSSNFANYGSFAVAAVFFIFLTIPLARFTDHIIREREKRERAQAV